MNRRTNRTLVLGVAVALLVSTSALASEAGEESSPRSPHAVEPLLAEIRARQAELDRREQMIDERERAYEELLSVVSSQLDEITLQRESLETQMQVFEKQGGERVKKLSRIYAAMPPAGAAQLLNELDPQLTTQILSKMKPKESAAVLGRLERQLAVTVSVEVANPLGIATRPTAPAGER